MNSIAGRPPNIVLILADDMGYGDFSAFNGGLSSTPVLDRLIGESVCLTQHYTGSPVCNPSRAALMTGRYPFRTGTLERFNDSGGMLADERCMADSMREAGYWTAIVGKSSRQLGTAIPSTSARIRSSVWLL